MLEPKQENNAASSVCYVRQPALGVVVLAVSECVEVPQSSIDQSAVGDAIAPVVCCVFLSAESKNPGDVFDSVAVDQ